VITISCVESSPIAAASHRAILRHSDNQNARIEHDRALDDGLLGGLAVTPTSMRFTTRTRLFMAWLQERRFDAAKWAQNPALPVT
jgi:hypothetical protein